MPKLPRVKPFKVIKALKRAGFYIDHITGSHYIFRVLNNSAFRRRNFRRFSASTPDKVY